MQKEWQYHEEFLHCEDLSNLKTAHGQFIDWGYKSAGEHRQKFEAKFDGKLDEMGLKAPPKLGIGDLKPL
jgi:hypothetical protein